ncbi:MAG: serine hydrolase domain-containing protein, partial [bacterium]
LFLLILCNAAIGQNYKLAKQKSNILLNAYIKTANVPGLSVAISIGDKIVYSNSFGYSDIDLKKAAVNSTEYRIGSVTKLFTALATVKLIDEDIIKSSDLVSKYIPGLPDSYQSMTIAELASHTAGIRHYTRDEIMSANAVEYADLEDGLSKFINDTLLSNPGEKYSYSSYGYVLLGAVLENAYRKKFLDIIDELVLVPSGMTNTSPEFPGRTYPDMSRFYYPPKDTVFIIAEGENYSYKWPAGGYLSTATDLAKFGSYMISGEFDENNILSLLFKPQKTNDGKDINVGYGFRIGTDNKGRKVVHHGGESQGARAFILIYPEYKLTVAMTANVFRAPLFEGEAETLAGYFLKDYKFKKNLLPKSIRFSTTYNNNPANVEIKTIEKKITGMTKTDIPIIDIVQDGSKIRVMALSSSGIINFWLIKDGETLKGKWGYDKETTDLKFPIINSKRPSKIN